MRRFLTFAVTLTGVVTAVVWTRAQDRRLIRPDSTLERRVALVIGNDKYGAASLVNAANDARAVAAALTDVRFAVETALNTSAEQMARAVGQFIARVQPGDVALFYYSGHGVQVDGVNYLIPVDFTGGDEVALKFRAVSVSEIDERLERKGARVRLLVLDACRDNPFRGTRSGTGGLASYTAEGALIVFATAAGKTASDNAGAVNGLFTQYFLEALRKPGVSAADMFKWVRVQVREQSDGRQVPWVHDGLIGDFVFRLAESPIVGSPAPNPVASAPLTPPAPVSTAARSGVRWAYARSVNPDTGSLARPHLDPLRQQLNVGLLFDGDRAGFVWVRTGLDVTSDLDARIAGRAAPPRTLAPVRGVAYVNLQQVVTMTTLGKEYAAQIQALTKKLTGELNDKQKALAALQQRLSDYGAVMSDAAKADLHKQIETTQRDVDTLQKESQASVQSLTERLQKQFEAAVRPVLEQFTARAGVDVVFDAQNSGLLYMSPSLDATSAIARMMESSGKADAPAVAALPPVGQGVYIDVQRLASESRLGKQLQGRMTALHQSKTRELGERNTTLTALRAKLAAGSAVLNDAARRQLERDIDRADTDLKRATEDAQKEVNDLQIDLQESFRQKLIPIITEYTRSHGIDIVFTAADSSILAGDSSLDITSAILRALDAAHPD